MRLVLIGPRGCGKTTVGRILADRLGCNFIDLDDLAAAQFDEPTIRDIWAAHGEAAWRKAEHHALQKLLTARKDEGSAHRAELILSLGGGAPMIPQARQLLEKHKRHGLRIVYLKCPVDVLEQRLTSNPGDRPNITDQTLTEEIAPILAEREPIYEDLAETVINAASAPDDVAAAILRQFDQQ